MLAQQQMGPLGPSITPHDIARLSVISTREAGIAFSAEKADFLLARVGRTVERLNLNSFREYCDLLEKGGSSDHLRTFIESITTHTTSFFRENAQYNWLENEGFQALWDNGVGRTRDLLVWSAACSTGQELYSAMMLTEMVGRSKLKTLRYRGIGTDLSKQVVNVASAAVYDEAEISGVPVEMRREFLLSSKQGQPRCRIAPDIRRKTEWRPANLTNSSTLSGIDADIIFLRNVLIYFDEETQGQVLRNVLSRLRPGGYLLTGHSETASIRKCDVNVVRPTIYQKGKS